MRLEMCLVLVHQCLRCCKAVLLNHALTCRLQLAVIFRQDRLLSSNVVFPMSYYVCGSQFSHVFTDESQKPLQTLFFHFVQLLPRKRPRGGKLFPHICIPPCGTLTAKAAKCLHVLPLRM